ncbi:hypothetical protein [uncultured Chitinophaga sp.]|uniref:hypothetical protein n=1 Tax=uncultured Chitinophaga sp. TaxID=339340 RepID=UPI0025F9B589|nr:hypothetical protein [uncultured Chitinophaga sp.]
MKLSPRQRKWLKGFLILLAIRLVIGLILYYIIEYRFREVIQVLVHRESHGKYRFDAEDVEFSIWKKNIRLKNATMTAVDTSEQVTRYQVKIPEVYLAISSWKQLIFHKNVQVDSLSIMLPDVQTLAASKAARKTGVTMQTSEILQVLRKTMHHLHVRKFNLHSGSFSYTSSVAPPFRTNQINLSATNFGGDSTDHRFLFADDVDLTITDQRWLMTGGLKEIKFRRLHFSGKDQFFQADSCLIVTVPHDGKAGMTLSVDKLFFKSTDLAAIYERDELILDTIICYHPVITLSPRKGNRDKKEKSDTGSIIRQSMSNLFKGITLKYVDVREGQIKLDYDSTRDASYATERTSLKIYNLHIQHEKRPHLTTDSIDLQLKGISFYTADSMYKMTIDELMLQRRDVLFSNAVFTPTELNRQKKGLSFTAPKLRMTNINIEDLVMRKLSADSAFLESPVIRFYANKRSKQTNDSSFSINNFYQTLNGVGELLKVSTFNISNGKVQYTPLGRGKEKALVSNINASFFLHELLKSDSLINIKQAIARLDIDRIDIDLPKLSLRAKDVRINGTRGLTSLDDLDLDLGNNIHVTGRQIFWAHLNWDALQRDNNIIADSVHVNSLTVDIGHKTTRNKKKAMPEIRIRKAGIEKLSFDGALAHNGKLGFGATKLFVDGLQSEGQYLKWIRTRGRVSDVRFSNDQTTASVKHILLDTRNESLISEAVFHSAGADVQVPSLKFRGDIRSTGITRIDIQQMQAEAPVIAINAGNGKKTTKPLNIPLDITLEHMLVNNGRFLFHGNDSLEVQTGINIDLRRLSANKNGPQALRYAQIDVTLPSPELTGKAMQANAGKTSIKLSNGAIARDRSLVTDIAAAWRQAQFHMQGKDSMELGLDDMNGDLLYAGFKHTPGKAVNWAAFLDKTNFQTGPLDWHNKNNMAHVDNIGWSAEGQHLRVDSIRFLPHDSQTTFIAAHNYQQPYLAFTASQLNMQGLREQDSTWKVRRVTLDGAQLTTAKDKRKPMPPGPAKPMLTQLMQRVGLPFHVDSLLVRDALVLTEETSPKTNMTSHIPVEHITVLVRNAGNRHASAADSLIIIAQLQLFNNQIKRLYYNESFADSLAGFTLQVAAAPMYLPNLTHITAPLAGIGVTRGTADTLYYRVHGHQYAAIGTMYFVYNDLRINLFNLPDTTRRTLITKVKNWAANLLVNKRNSKDAFIFYERNTDKMFLNYWINSTLRGLMASAGLRKNKKAFMRYMRRTEEDKIPWKTE